MKEIDLRTTTDLADYFGRSKGSLLFRGQTTHYEDARGDTSISSSIGRHGCIPSVMRQWTYYADSILNHFRSPRCAPAI